MFKLRRGDGAFEQVDLPAAYLRALASAGELNALGAGVRALVVLARKVFYGEQLEAIHLRKRLVIDEIAVRLGENGIARSGVFGVIDARKVIDGGQA